MRVLRGPQTSKLSPHPGSSGRRFITTRVPFFVQSSVLPSWYHRHGGLAQATSPGCVSQHNSVKPVVMWIPFEYSKSDHHAACTSDVHVLSTPFKLHRLAVI
eukprot:scpid113379/ scgid16878/ 